MKEDSAISILVRVAIERPVTPCGFCEIELPANPAALYSLVSRDFLLRVGIQPLRRLLFQLPDWKLVERDVGAARFHYGGYNATSTVIFGETADNPRLGLLTLESLGLEVDWAQRRLRPMRMILYSSRPAA